MRECGASVYVEPRCPKATYSIDDTSGQIKRDRPGDAGFKLNYYIQRYRESA